MLEEDINNLFIVKFWKVNSEEKVKGDKEWLFVGVMIYVGVFENLMECLLFEDDVECCICFLLYEDGVEFCDFFCFYYFYGMCINKWLCINVICFFCKYNIVYGNRNWMEMV